MRASLVILSVLSSLFILTADAAGQTCRDWSQSLDLPRHDPSILGDACLVDGTTVFVAGSEFQVVDLSDPEIAVVLGSIPLPAPTLDILHLGDFVYLVLDGLGIWEIDVSSPGSPLQTRAFTAATNLTRIAEIDPYLMALDDQSRLHVIDGKQGGPLTEISVQTLPVAAKRIGRIGGFLALYDLMDVVIMDFSDPLAGVEVSRVAGGMGWGTDVGICEDYILQFHTEPYWTTSWLYKFTVDETGQITRTPYGSLNTWITLVAARPGMLVMNAKGRNYLFDPATPGILAQFYVDPDSWIDTSTERWAGVSPTEGLAWCDISFPEMVPSMFVFSDFTRSSYCDFDLTETRCWSYGGWGAGDYWVDRMRYSRDSDIWFDVTVYDVHDPLNPFILFDWDNTDYEPVIYDGRWLVFNSLWEYHSDCIHSCSIRDLETGQRVFAAGGANIQNYGGGIFWVEYYDEDIGCPPPQEIRGYRVNSNGTVTEVVTLDASFPRIVGSFDHYVIARYSYDWMVFDFSDPDNVVEIASIRAPGDWAVFWDDPKATFTFSGNQMFSLDFSDPADPVLVAMGSTPFPIDSWNFDSGYVVFNYRDQGIQLGRLQEDGTLTLVSPILAGSFGGWEVVGNQLYVSTGPALQLYDITDPAAPRYVGQANGYYTGVMEVGHYLISGGAVFELDCGLVEEIELNLDPASPPVEIPAVGGSFQYSILLDLPESLIVQAVIDAVLPDGEVVTVRTPPTFDLDEGTHAWTALTQEVPAHAPPGTYTYRCNLVANDGRTADAAFEFVKLDGAVANPAASGWTLTGWDPDEPALAEMPASRLHGAAPNPFNPATTIAFELPYPQAVTLRVFDLQGRLVRTLIRGEVHLQGRHETVWDGRDDAGRQAASGIYFFRLDAEGWGETVRAALLK